MKTLFSLIAILFFSVSALADIQLAPPNQLLKKAGEGRIELREVILDIEKNIPEMRDPSTFDSYFEILDELSDLAGRFQLDEIYPEAVRKLGEKMVSNGVRWLKIETDSKDRVLAYHHWMSLSLAEDYQSEIERVALDEKDPAKLRTLAENTGALVFWAEKRFPENARLSENYRRILSGVAASFLKRNPSREEAIFWVDKISHPDPFAILLESVREQVYGLTRENRKTAHEILFLVTKVNQRMEALKNRLPAYLFSMLGEISVDLLMRMTKLEEPLETEELNQAINMLQNRHLQALGSLWISRGMIPSPAYAENYLAISRALALALYERGLHEDSDNFNAFIGRIAAPLMGRALNAEGTYELKDKFGKKWKFSLALVREDQYFAALNDAEGFVHKPFTYVEYDFAQGAFLASLRERDADPEQIWTLKFKISGKKIEAFDPWARPGRNELTGVKTQEYPDYFAEAPGPNTSPGGRYLGELTFGNGLKLDMVLIVSAFNGYTMARLADVDGRIHLDMNVGSRGTDGRLYLTTGVDRATWTQVRGRLTDKEFRGVVIIGGREMTKNFVMKKVTE